MKLATEPMETLGLTWDSPETTAELIERDRNLEQRIRDSIEEWARRSETGAA